MILKSVVVGVIGLTIGLLATYVVSLIIPTTNLTWSLIAVAFASFFAAFSGYMVGWKQKE